jgi:hypothetical protein
MSQIADFHIFPESKLQALVSTFDLSGGRALETLPFSGDVLLTLSMLGELMIGSHEPEAARLAEARGNSVVLFDVAAGQT